MIGKLNPLRELEETVLSFINKSCSDPSKETVVIRRNVQDIVYFFFFFFFFFFSSVSSSFFSSPPRLRDCV